MTRDRGMEQPYLTVTVTERRPGASCRDTASLFRFLAKGLLHMCLKTEAIVE